MNREVIISRGECTIVEIQEEGKKVSAVPFEHEDDLIDMGYVCKSKHRKDNRTVTVWIKNKKVN